MKMHGCWQASVRHRDFRKCDHAAAAILLAVRFGEAKVETPDWKIFKKPGDFFPTRPYHRDMWLWGIKQCLILSESHDVDLLNPANTREPKLRRFVAAMKRMILTQVKNANSVMHLSQKVSAKMAAAGGHA